MAQRRLCPDLSSYKALSRKWSVTSSAALVMVPSSASSAAGNGSPGQLPSFVFSEFKINYFHLFAGGV